MIDTIYSDPDFLVHYGVKGMKWGVRNDYVPIGRPRSNRFITNEDHNRSKIERGADFLRNTNSIQDAKKAIDKKIDYEKVRNVLLATAGITAAAVVGMKVYKNGKIAADSVLKSGTLVQNIGRTGKNFDVSFYGVTDQKDRLFYLKNYSKKAGLLDKVGRTQATVLTNNNDLTIAGKKAMNQAYRDVYGNSKLKREIFYRRFGALSEEQRAPFMNQLKSKGYSGFKDINDMQFGFGGKTPTVFFGKDSGLKVKTASKINVDRAKKIKVLTDLGKESVAVSGLSAVSVGSAYGASRASRKVKKKSK